MISGMSVGPGVRVYDSRPCSAVKVVVQPGINC